MSATHICDKCGHTFKQKSHLTQHQNRKKPCVVESKLKEYVAETISHPVAIIPVQPTKPTFVEVCAGCGGLSSGLMKAGFVPLLLNDNNKDCCATLAANHKGANVICAPMEKLDLTPYIGKVDVLTGGIPCQSFSQAGLRKGLDDPRGELMGKFADMIHTIQPTIFMVENVKGLITHNAGETIKEVIQLFNRDDLYDVYYRVLNAAEYSVPQKRERVFIVGSLKSRNIQFQFPVKNETPILLKHVLVNVPPSPCATYNADKIALYKQIPQGGCWVNLPENLQRMYLGNSFASGGGKRGILYRLSMEKTSLTLLCSPSQKQTERCHPLEERPLSVREYARIQTFDDAYSFSGGITSQYKQIGNAVPVELARQMGVCLARALVAV